MGQVTEEEIKNKLDPEEQIIGEEGRPARDDEHHSMTKEEFERLKAEGEIEEIDFAKQFEKRALELSTKDWKLCEKIYNKVINFVVKLDYENEDELAEQWYKITHSIYAACSKAHRLEPKPEVTDPSTIPFHAFAIKLSTNKPYIFLLIGSDGHINMFDEGRFDAFFNGPFIQPE